MKWTSESLEQWLRIYYAKGTLQKKIQTVWRNTSFLVNTPLQCLPKAILNSLPEVEPRVLARTWKWLNNDEEIPRDIILNLPNSAGPNEYPTQLKEIHDAPCMLFVEGDSSLLNSTQLAVVGSRKAPNVAYLAIQQFLPECIRHGICITSGLAMGVDSSAHQLCVEQGGKTIAVLGCGIDLCYPPRAKQLRKDILNSGLIVSEYPPGTAAKTEHFPRRNRIISGLSHAVWVVAATPRSGSLITARLALEQNREVLAIPYGVFESAGLGCNELIKNGAKLVNSSADLIEVYALFISNLESGSEHPHLTGVGDKQQEMFATGLAKPEMLANVGFETTPLEQILERSGKTVAQAMNSLVGLELDGWIKAVPGGYVRVRR
ncbi:MULTISPECIES: DNA-processing protein DprA [Gammaproteobacteria]|uniref:DNA-processing protein DprA n=1 Tax=Gammaproteobacteria TaxID=1236 RepID=UPI000DCF8EB1|nr:MULTISPECIES: DNA-processing protein DprA [Gammaproteobacteria]RTE86667.1 DNA-protecting protein DprA [Aliidiomarina sp. B3213]TCZ90780.1 DNA-protecting protein DprA [Lysobacter sp. N42]